jgi:hypothetical protein
MTTLWKRCFLLLLTGAAAMATAERQPVLKQIELPHHYYYREMYLPQLTTGPSSVTWSPDSQVVVYSMQGSLWRQRVVATTAEQLTFGPGYHYQPHWSPDGRWIVFAAYDNDAVELRVLDLQSGEIKQLTDGGHVNVEPSFSPDGQRLAFVSTAFNRRFHIFVGDFRDGRLENVQRLTGETRTDVPRYYYSPFDHEISPTWSPDGSELIFVHNHGRIYGTGGFWRMEAKPGAAPREVHYEETTWQARPQWSPDGKRLVYSSYLGRQWHQLWVLPAAGGDAFAISYGEFDNTAPRWSPDGKRIAFISNRDGNTSLWIQDVVGGAQRKLEIRERKYLRPMGTLTISVLDAQGQPTAARVSVRGADGREYAPDDAWMHGDEMFDRAERMFEAHYFHANGRAEVTVPAGEEFTVEAMKGFEYRFEQRKVTARAGTTPVRLTLRPLNIPQRPGMRLVSSDLHVHMNYAGSYRNTPKKMLQQAHAENLHIVHNLIVNKEQRVPDIAYFSTKPDAASTRDAVLLHAQEFHTSFWGHMGLLNLKHNYLLPDYSAYANTAAASLFPDNAEVARLTHEQKGLVGYVHPFEIEDLPDPKLDRRLSHALPVDAALGNVDYIEVLGFSDHNSTASVWYRLLNLGIKVAAGAGTDAMANYASLHGPVGLNRVHTWIPQGAVNAQAALDALRRGDTMASNGPLLGFSLAGRHPGDEIQVKGVQPLRFHGWLRSIVPIEHLELVCNGKVERAFPLAGARDSADIFGEVTLSDSGWCLLRARSDQARHPILDIYPYATTGAVFVMVDGRARRNADDAAYFIGWIDRILQAVERHQDWNTPEEKRAILERIQQARKLYESKR